MAEGKREAAELSIEFSETLGRLLGTYSALGLEKEWMVRALFLAAKEAL